MHHFKNKLILLFIALSNPAWAQGPISGFMQGRGVTDIALAYSGESYNSYFFGKEEQSISNELTSWSLFLEHGFSDSFFFFFTVPYIKIDEVNKGIPDGFIAI